MQSLTGLSGLSSLVSGRITYSEITLVQQLGQDGGSGSSGTITWAQPTQEGNLLVAALGNYLGGTPTAPSGWVSAVSEASGSSKVYIWYIANAASRSGDETFSLSSSFDGVGWLALAEYGGIKTSSPFDQGASSYGFSSGVTTGITPTTTATKELWIAIFAYSATVGFTAVTNGFTVLNQGLCSKSTSTGSLLALITSSEGGASVSATLDAGTSANCAGAIATFKGA